MVDVTAHTVTAAIPPLIAPRLPPPLIRAEMPCPWDSRLVVSMVLDTADKRFPCVVVSCAGRSKVVSLALLSVLGKGGDPADVPRENLALAATADEAAVDNGNNLRGAFISIAAHVPALLALPSDLRRHGDSDSDGLIVTDKHTALTLRARRRACAATKMQSMSRGYSARSQAHVKRLRSSSLNLHEVSWDCSTDEVRAVSGENLAPLKPRTATQIARSPEWERELAAVKASRRFQRES